jgi:hypothetical protein
VRAGGTRVGEKAQMKLARSDVCRDFSFSDSFHGDEDGRYTNGRTQRVSNTTELNESTVSSSRTASDRTRIDLISKPYEDFPDVELDCRATADWKPRLNRETDRGQQRHRAYCKQNIWRDTIFILRIAEDNSILMPKLGGWNSIIVRQ